MFGYGTAASFLTLAVVGLTTACTPSPWADASPARDLEALQAGGEIGMGVDQNVSTHTVVRGGMGRGGMGRGAMGGRGPGVGRGAP